MKSSLLLASACLTLLAIALMALPALAQRSADVSLEQSIEDALVNAGFDPGPADGKFGPKTRQAIQAWQRANGHEETGFLDRDQIRSLLTKAIPIVTLEPKCAELPGQYLGENHAECWEEIQNQAGCYLWRTHYHSDQVTQWTGQCRSGVAEGHGTYSVSAGSEHSSYEGSGLLVNGKANGLWVEELGDGAHHEGEYRDGIATGIWAFKWANGNLYEGEYRDGKLHGYGTYTWANGNRYEGEFRDDEPNGYGTYTWASGDHYEGAFRDGKQSGQGTLTRSDGSLYMGGWRDGEKHGHGVLTGRDGSGHEGEYRHGKPNGYGIYFFADGNRLQGHWRDGCFNDESGWAAVDTTPAACGFEFKTSPDVVPDDEDYWRP